MLPVCTANVMLCKASEVCSDTATYMYSQKKWSTVGKNLATAISEANACLSPIAGHTPRICGL